MKRIGVFVCILTLLSVPTAAATLEDKLSEWAFSVTSVDQDDIGEVTELDFQWSYMFYKGYLSVGIAVSAFNIEFDDDVLDDLAGGDGSAVGPLFQWNWTPAYERASGFLFVSAQGISGDLDDQFSSAVTGGIGVKAFLGNSAAIIAFISQDKFNGDSGFDDLDQSRLGVGLALYTHGQ